jgi:UDPglucose 6-dehydrogenase
MKIAVIGSGYVGLVAGACFADTGNTVYCVDQDASKIASLKNGEIPIFEPGLETLVRRGTQEGRLLFSTSTEEAVQNSEIIFMAVGTPPLPNGEPNLSYLKSAAESVAKAMTGYRIIVNKSTVPIGSHRVVAEWMSAFAQHPFDVVSNPEFLKEGSAIEDFLKPDRVVIGTDQEKVYLKMAELYAPFVRQGNPVLWMDPVSAEMTKYACNAFLAARISFMNELSRLCEKVGGDIEEVRKGMSLDVRIGKHFLYAGAGYGGSCFPKDVQALMSTGRKMETPMTVVTAVEEANLRQKQVLGQKVMTRFKGELKGKTFAIWGLAFKPNTDDMREAPSIDLIHELTSKGAHVQVFDPVANSNAQKVLGTQSIRYCHSAYEALEGADALVVVTEWNEFRHPDFSKMKTLLKNSLIFDGRNIYAPKKMAELGFEYHSIGRKVIG